MFLWYTSPPSSWLADFPYKVIISCPNKTNKLKKGTIQRVQGPQMGKYCDTK